MSQRLTVLSKRVLKPYSRKVLATQSGNLIAYWPLHESSGSVAEDLSGNGRDGAYTPAQVRTGLANKVTIFGSGKNWRASGDACRAYLEANREAWEEDAP